MTTQNTHHENSDVDASVVEHPPVPESTVDSSTSETVIPAETEVQAEVPSSDRPVTPAEVQATAPQETSEVPEASVTQTEEQGATTEQEDQTQETHTPEVTTDVDVEPAFTPSTIISVEESVAVSHSDPAPLLEAAGEEVRSFTDFIEEFRQAEEARLNASRQEGPTEAFALLAGEAATPMIEQPLIAEESASAGESGGEAFFSPAIDSRETPLEEEHSPLIDFTAPIVEQQEIVTEQPNTPATPTERAVSPLLRPATRLRIPRHGGSRHVREELAAENTAAPVTPASVEQAEQAAQPAPPESTAESEQPRPARRYRFDRPSSNGLPGTTGAAPVQLTTSQQRTEESRDKDAQNRATGPFSRTEPAQNGNEQQAEAFTTTTKPAASTSNTGNSPVMTPPAEQPAQKQPTEQEVLPAESTGASSTPEHGRRRQGQERHKEQQPVTILPADAVTPVTEPAAQPGEVPPEDLPPLEYSELQKANTRRRRRHRTSASNGSSAPVSTESSPVAPVTPPAQPTATTLPATPPSGARPVVAPGTNGNQYSIVSGYTVSQMNQGSEVTGPFMGPEPSPARGSIVTRDGRTARAEAQRSSVYPPTRTHEAAPSSLNHFANVISQAIQTQTDRMVAELRRGSQSPTNVSVSLPPFPSTERVGVFVDVANLLYSARTLRIAVDFGKLLDFLRGNRRLVRAHAYCPTSPQAGDEQMFLQAVKGLGYRITTKNYKTFSSGAKKADLDLDLCMDVVRLVDGRAVDCIVLVSGDSDFMPMLDYCSDHGVRVEVAAFDEAMSATLRQSCDLFINLSMLEEIRS